MKTLDNVMFEHPSLDLRSHELYDPQFVESADDDLIKAILNPPAFPLLVDLRRSDRLKTFEEILSSAVDEDEDYRRLIDQVIRSFLHLESLGHTLSGQLIGVLVDLTAEFEKVSRQMHMEVKPVEEEEELDSGTEVVPDSEVGLEGERRRGQGKC